jgi:hypothetical protein
MPAALLHLQYERVHIGIKPHIDDEGFIDAPAFDMHLSLCEHVGQRGQKLDENGDRDLVHRNAHGRLISREISLAPKER